MWGKAIANTAVQCKYYIATSITCYNFYYYYTFSIASAIGVEHLFSLPFASVHTLCFLQYEDHRVDQRLWNVCEGLAW